MQGLRSRVKPSASVRLVHQTADTSLLVPVAACFMEGSPQSPPCGLYLPSPTSLPSIFDRCFVLSLFPSDDQHGLFSLFIFTPQPMLVSFSQNFALRWPNIEIIYIHVPPTLHPSLFWVLNQSWIRPKFHSAVWLADADSNLPSLSSLSYISPAPRSQSQLLSSNISPW